MIVAPKNKPFGPREAELVVGAAQKGRDANNSEIRKWVRTEEAAAHMQRSPSALVSWRFKGFGPPYSKINRVVVYDVADLDAWIEAHRVEPKPRLSSEQEAA